MSTKLDTWKAMTGPASGNCNTCKNKHSRNNSVDDFKRLCGGCMFTRGFPKWEWDGKTK